MSKREPRVMDHEYDGILEYDNPTPGWWHGIFLASILFSLVYFAFWEFSPEAPSIHDRWRSREVAEFQRIFGRVGELTPDEPTVLRMMGDSKMMAVAGALFIGNCAACHAKDGGAGGGAFAGVNLTDDFYKNVKKLPDLLTTIARGANNGAMPAWENRLSQNQRIILAAYVARLRGTTPAAGKPPEGDRIDPWPAPPPPSAGG